MSWQPIETAPKDGTFVLAVTESGYRVIVQWCADKFWRSNVPHAWEPTHWMPLPEPPQ